MTGASPGILRTIAWLAGIHAEGVEVRRDAAREVILIRFG
jgi:hypothetical protein